MKSISNDLKATIIRRHTVDNVPISKLAKEYKLSPSTLYAWRKKLIVTSKKKPNIQDVKSNKHLKPFYISLKKYTLWFFKGVMGASAVAGAGAGLWFVYVWFQEGPQRVEALSLQRLNLISRSYETLKNAKDVPYEIGQTTALKFLIDNNLNGNQYNFPGVRFGDVSIVNKNELYTILSHNDASFGKIFVENSNLVFNSDQSSIEISNKTGIIHSEHWIFNRSKVKFDFYKASLKNLLFVETEITFSGRSKIMYSWIVDSVINFDYDMNSRIQNSFLRDSTIKLKPYDQKRYQVLNQVELSNVQFDITPIGWEEESSAAIVFCDVCGTNVTGLPQNMNIPECNYSDTNLIPSTLQEDRTKSTLFQDASEKLLIKNEFLGEFGDTTSTVIIAEWDYEISTCTAAIVSSFNDSKAKFEYVSNFVVNNETLEGAKYFVSQTEFEALNKITETPFLKKISPNWYETKDRKIALQARNARIDQDEIISTGTRRSGRSAGEVPEPVDLGLFEGGYEP